MNFWNNLFTKTISNLSPQNYQGIAKGEKDIDKGKIVNLKNAQSTRYDYGGDLGQTESDTKGGQENINKSGSTGLYTAKQMHEAGIDTSVENRPNDVDVHDIQSTCIEDVKYSPKKRIAEVIFRNGNGKAYSYPNVSPEDMKTLLRAPSKGIAFGKYIKPHAQPDFRGKI